ncbi:MAG: hypothetical protein WA004_18185 [Saprospiraceae bacterium]
MPLLKYLCFSLLFFAAASLPSQLTIGFGYEIDGFDADRDLNHYATTYNAYMGNALDKPLRQMGAFSMAGLYGSLGYRFTKPGFTFGATAGYGRSSFTNTSELNNNFAQEHILRFSDLNFLFSGGPVFAKMFFLEGVINIGFRTPTMEVATIYPDGSRSLSYEYDINGIYTGFTPCYELGGSLGIRLGRMLVSARVTRAFPVFEGDPELADIATLQDADTNRFRSNDFPRDFGQWVDSGTNYDPENAVRTNGLRGTRIALSVEFFFGKPFKE